jgi:hypothetical protein
MKVYQLALLAALAATPTIAFTTPPGGLTINNAVAPVVVVGSSAAATANSNAINAAIQLQSTAGGGIVQLPCGTIFTSATLDNNVSGVLVQGCAPLPQWTVPLVGAPPSGTTIVPTFAGTVLKHRTPYATQSVHQNAGGGFADLSVIGNSVATRLLEVDSISGGTYRLFVADSMGTDNVYIHVCTSGRNLFVCDSQHGTYDIQVQQLVNSADAINIQPSSNADWSGNVSVSFDVIHKNGLGLRLEGGDGNVIWWGSYRVTGGTGNAALLYGQDGKGQGAYSNVFSAASVNMGDGLFPSFYEQGTSDSGVSAGVQNIILHWDNNAGNPTAGAGSGWTFCASNAAASHKFGCYQNVGGSVNEDYSTSIISNFGAEEFEFSPGLSTNVNRLLSYNRASNAYVEYLLDAAAYVWNVKGVRTMFLNSSKVLDVAGGYSTKGKAGVSCAAGTVNLTTLVVTDGIVTHC